MKDFSQGSKKYICRQYEIATIAVVHLQRERLLK